jgi:hypothetical protein
MRGYAAAMVNYDQIAIAVVPAGELDPAREARPDGLAAPGLQIQPRMKSRAPREGISTVTESAIDGRMLLKLETETPPRHRYCIWASLYYDRGWRDHSPLSRITLLLGSPLNRRANTQQERKDPTSPTLYQSTPPQAGVPSKKEPAFYAPSSGFVNM